jgi:protein-disulfide isomerase
MPKKLTKVVNETTFPVKHGVLQTKKFNGNLILFFGLLKKVSTTQVLVLLLIVASFLIGVLVTKVQYLEKGQANSINTNQAAAPAAAQPAAQQQGLTDGQIVNVGVGGFPVMGNSNAKVTIVEFADFRCPFCEKFFTDTLSQIKKDYVDTGKAKFYFRNFPFLGDASIVAANAAECANDQGKFWEFHDYLYKNQPSESDTSMYNADTLSQAAATLGLNSDQFKTCLTNKTDQAKTNKDLSEGQAAGVSGTPTLFINGIAIIGAQPYSAFKTIIDKELAK